MKNTIYILLLFLCSQVIAGLAATLLGWAGDFCRMGYCMLAANILLIATLRLTHLAGMRSAWAPLPYWLSPRLCWALLAILLMALSTSFLTNPLQLADFGTQKMFEAMRNDPFCLILLCVAGPLAEELVFRDGIQRQLLRWRLSPLWAIIVSALLFAAVHGNPQQAVPAFVLGAVLSMFFQLTGDLRLCLPAHIFNNTLAVVSLAFPAADAWMEQLSSGLSIAIGLVCLAASMIVIFTRLWRTQH